MAPLAAFTWAVLVGVQLVCTDALAPPPPLRGPSAVPRLRGGARELARSPRSYAPTRVTYEVPVHEAPLEVRDAFVERVYRTLSLQLGATMLLCWYLITYHPGLLVNIMRDRTKSLLALFSPMVAAMIVTNAPTARKTWPTDHLLLALFTACEGLVLSLVTLFVPREIIWRAGLTTAAVVGWLSLYARTTRRDFTRRGSMLLNGLLALTVLQLLQLVFFRGSPMSHSLFSAVGALAFAGMLVVNTQQIVGGKSTHAQIAPDEHVLASILLYTDIVALFMHLVSIMSDGGGGGRQRERGGAGMLDELL